MGIANAAQRKGKNDFYQTPHLATQALLKNYSFDGKSILDPCEGRGAISAILEWMEYNITGIDKYPVLPSTIEQDFLKYDKTCDVIIGNAWFHWSKNTISWDGFNDSYELYEDLDKLEGK